MVTPSNDRGGIIIGWFVKLVVGLALTGLVLFDAASLVITRINAEDKANDAAIAAAHAYRSSRDVRSAYQAAVATSGPTDTIPESTFVVNRDGSISLQLTSEATTLVAHRIGPLKKYVTATQVGRAGPAV